VKKVIKIGFIGAGGIAWTHFNALQKIAGAQVTAIADPFAERAVAMAQKCGGKVFTDYREFLSDVDAVYINTPPSMHCEQAITAAQAGKHIFCEKPLAVKLDEAVRLVEAVQNSRILMMTGFVLRFQRAFRFMRDFVTSGEVGDIVAYYCHRIGLRTAKPNHWATDPQLLCGMTVQSFSHDGDLLCWLLDTELVEVNASVLYRPGLPGFDEDMVATVQLANGAVANFVLSWSSHLASSQRTIIGTLGTVSAEAPDLWRVNRIQWRENASPGDREIIFSKETADDRGYVEENRHFIESIRRSIPSSCTASDGLRALRMSTAVLMSSQQNRTVSMEEVCRL
jgi:predicted dehydrogenase